ncbi:outer membrane beta-barrel protein [Algoriphagus boritolerans]|uniref:Outer membrane protein beta-barrel domain-containing protein n=1 Tax=Algoriphagus boritolerans DSM 17298 = JCM 18970 TaxID=1120964 RepID=A0A1H5VXK5_9BACT|nr:outer membrane beta-barrel protein [Algoriphagus boritolerans]SEF91706.1 Outer membrane protein beta-barrel domain-containing protein [Algoriphagus boritolerans DSM 17298 = JCM 18970]
MKKLFFSIIIVFINHVGSFGQEKFFEKIELGFSGGLAVPVGHFKEISIAPSLEPVPPGSIPERFQGFLKNEGGQAELGYSLGLNLTYHLTPSVFISLNYLKTQHTIDTHPQQIYYDANFKSEIDLNGVPFEVPGRLESDPYRANLFYLGIGYRLPINRMEVRFTGLAGMNNLEFPFYIWFFQISETFEIISRPFPIDGPVPTSLREFAYGLETKLTYSLSQKLNMNLAATYLRSDHPHDYWTNTLAASILHEIQDEIRYRNLAVQFGVSYRFTGKE